MIAHSLGLVYARSGWLYAFSDIEWWTLSTYTMFLFFNVFLISTIGSTLFTVLADFIDNPTTVITLLATGMEVGSICPVLTSNSGFLISSATTIAILHHIPYGCRCRSHPHQAVQVMIIPRVCARHLLGSAVDALGFRLGNLLGVIFRLIFTRPRTPRAVGIPSLMILC